MKKIIIVLLLIVTLVVAACVSPGKNQDEAITGDAIKNVCLGVTPAGSVICPGDDQNLAGGVQKKLTSYCSKPAGSAPKCQYICNQGYKYWGPNETNGQTANCIRQ